MKKVEKIIKTIAYQCSACRELYSSAITATKCEKECKKRKLLAPKIAQIEKQAQKLERIANGIESDINEPCFGAYELEEVWYACDDEVDYEPKEIKKSLKEAIKTIDDTMKNYVANLIKSGALRDEVDKLLKSV